MITAPQQPVVVTRARSATADQAGTGAADAAGADGSCAPAQRVLLLHGLASGSAVWDRFVARAHPALELWTAELPWRGSGVPGWPDRPAADWVDQAVAEVPGGPDVVIAHSFGANALLSWLDRPGVADAGVPAADAGVPAADAGVPAADAGVPAADAGVADTGAPAAKAGVADTAAAGAAGRPADAGPTPPHTTADHPGRTDPSRRSGHRAPRGAVLVSPFYRAREEQFDWAAISYYLNRFDTILADGLRVSSGGRLREELQQEMALRVRDQVGPYGWMRFFETYLGTPRLRLARLGMPFLVVGGETDFAAFPAEAEALGRALPRAEVRVLPDVGHFTMVERADEFSAAVNAFLGTLAPTPLRGFPLSSMECNR